MTIIQDLGHVRDLAQSGAGTLGEIGGSFSLPASDALNLLAQASYRHALADVEGEAVSVSGGARHTW